MWPQVTSCLPRLRGDIVHPSPDQSGEPGAGVGNPRGEKCSITTSNNNEVMSLIHHFGDHLSEPPGFSDRI